MPPDLSTVLRVEGLGKRFGGFVAVDGLSFELARGEVLGLLGPNGAGKTTSLLCLCGLMRPDSGSISYEGRTLGSDRGRTIALIPESPDVYAMLTVWEHMLFVARSLRLRNWEPRAQSLLDRLGIAQKRDTLGQALSKGMRQKTLIAATLLAQSPILLLDEPMVGLDPRGQRELRELVSELRAGGTSIMMSTHIIDSAEAMCDRLIIMKNGRMLASGRTSDLRLRAPSGQTLEDLFLEITA
ncbi:MAG TPA: ABC transporter ATP-binding protein [Candidatus Baltobacteraceae bacterium]